MLINLDEWSPRLTTLMLEHFHSAFPMSREVANLQVCGVLSKTRNFLNANRWSYRH
jgi:hypothetical protein